MRSHCRHHLVDAFERTQQTSLLRLRVPHRPSKWSCAPRCYATTTSRHSGTRGKQSRSLAIPSEGRYNEIGVQHVSSHMYPQLFPASAKQPPVPDRELVDLSRQHLSRHDLLGKTSDETEPIGFDLPDLQGGSLDEHFHKLGMDSAEPYLTLSKKYARASPPAKPRRWAQKSGWTKYSADGSWEAIDAPDADVLTFDTEVMWHETSFPAMALSLIHISEPTRPY